MKPKYKIGQTLRWYSKHFNRFDLLTIIDIRHDQYHYEVHGEDTGPYSRYVHDVDRYENVTPYIEPNKIWKDLNEA
jgi:hypothetical protein